MPSTALPPLASGPEASAWRVRLRRFRELLRAGLRATCARETPVDTLWLEPEPRRSCGAERARFIDLPGGTVLRQPDASERWERGQGRCR